jgi:hypothetical protein
LNCFWQVIERMDPRIISAGQAATLFESHNNPRAILGIAILAAPLVLMAWGWFRLLRRRPSDPQILSWSPSVVCLFLMTVSYGLTLAQIFSPKLERYLFSKWHSNDIGVYFLISLLACPISWVGKGPIRNQVLALGILLSILYFAAGYSMAD